MSNPTGSKDRRLGKGLAALLGTPLDEDMSQISGGGNRRPAESPSRSSEKGTSSAKSTASNDSESKTTSARSTSPKKETHESGERSVELSVYEIDNNPFQPRREFNEEEIASLAESLKEHEQLQPVIVRKVGARYQLISGERRLRAAIHAGLPTVRADIRDADDRLVAELAIIENLQRKDLNAIEKAMSFRRYIDEHQCTQEDLANRLKIDRSTIANLMRLLELPAAVIDQVNNERISSSHARALLPLGDERQQVQLGKQIEEEKWSVRATEHHVSALLQAEDEEESGVIRMDTTKKKRTVSPHIQSLQQDLRMQLGTKVEIRETSKGRGKITIHFSSPEEFERLQQLMGTDAVVAA
ncbi:putative chromosome-partitioning protein ParB [Roseimaritima multifibrata]|uniref:Putative chromosome-partitioning protein ParB n=1 Tax=Roseimaritima multifibrata TaxID=1930274 RepID=A0A517ME36_9BACT|nr:ParB/RepB/Spo0J family partition protein [Roseimaritima multifibrata]QDS93148.1 putative chromosome-partitioning protein ParB [Roseimaritima multifibrata]